MSAPAIVTLKDFPIPIVSTLGARTIGIWHLAGPATSALARRWRASKASLLSKRWRGAQRI